MSKHDLSRRSFLKLAAIGTAASATAASGIGNVAQAAPQWVRKGKRVKSLAAFDQLMIEFMSTRGIRDGSLAITKDGRLVLARGYSYVGNPAVGVAPNTLFRIASISKPITAVAVMRMVQDGLLGLDDKITDHIALVPMPSQTPDPRLQDITIRHLLQHLGGWNRDISFDPMFYDFNIAAALGKSLPITGKDIITYMNGRTLNFDPGSAYSYSNYGYLLLEQLFQPLANLKYAKYVRRKVFKKLGIKRSVLGRTAKARRLPNEARYFTQYKGTTVLNNSGKLRSWAYGPFNIENMKAHGGWLSTAVDLVKFASAFDDPANSPILSEAMINEMFAVPSIGINGDGSWYGCGWAVRTAGAGLNTWHFGSLPGTFTGLIRRSDGLNWAFLFNERFEGSGPDNFGDIDWMMHDVANSISSWPTHDLFPRYL